ncbi:hypothetical protein ACL02U_12070 [Streptomyces sp. MS06]|uniref:hypothetical protein n=1 Tax=Streptomyces sp. MS06 TaxID=3385974 RepID=UPI0039A34C48
MSATELAQAYYVAQTSLARRTADRVQALWRELDRRDLTGSWVDLVGPRVVEAVVAGQVAAASRADPYVESIVAAQGGRSDPAGALRAAMFAGRAADGRPLESLLYLPVITTKQGIAAGLSDTEALFRGLEQLLRMAATEVMDAGRTAAGASIAGNRMIRGYIRVVNPPACARCIILAGKEYGWNAGFQRHPRCDCVHMPALLVARGRHHAGAFDPKAYFNGLSRSEQDRVFTVAGARAIRDGASPTSVVNARRGMYTADAYGRKLRATREGATTRGAFYRQERARAIAAGQVPANIGRQFRTRTPRLLPESIYRLADSRDEAIRMLRRFGYIG